ncbi:MAG: hypothetical protein M1817_004259 [Caeruleum heppii]|nr:MAG: hypothetical protein M1817_004259 [Caeruleum heppii]
MPGPSSEDDESSLPRDILRRLPLELLDEIFAYISPSDCVALLQTCPELYYLGDSTIIQRAYLVCRSDAAERLRVFCFRDGEAGEHACPACWLYHPSDWFDAGELARRPKNRTCRRVYVCGHVGISLTHHRAVLDALRAGLHHSDQRYPKFKEVAPCSHGIIGHGHRCWGVVCKLLEWQALGLFSSKYQLLTLHYVGLGQWFHDGRATLTPALVRLVEYEPELQSPVCPHMTMISCVKEMVAERAAECFVERTKHRWSTSCTVCSTHVDGSGFDGGVFLRVRRYLGRGTSPLDPNWLAQVTSRFGEARQVSNPSDFYPFYRDGWVSFRRRLCY